MNWQNVTLDWFFKNNEKVANMWVVVLVAFALLVVIFIISSIRKRK